MAVPAALHARRSSRRWEATACPTITYQTIRMLNDFHSSTGSGPPGPVKPPGNSRRGPPGHEPPSHASENKFMLHFATSEPVKENVPPCQISENESWHTLGGLAHSIGSDRSARFRQRSASRLTGPEGLRHCAFSRQPTFHKHRPTKQI